MIFIRFGRVPPKKKIVYRGREALRENVKKIRDELDPRGKKICVKTRQETSKRQPTYKRVREGG